MPSVNQFKRFDVRDMVSRGIKPFPEIRKRVDTLKPVEGLIVAKAPTGWFTFGASVVE